MTRLVLTPNLKDPDDIYDRLLAAHDGLNDAESAALNARLILLLMNHIGDREVLAEATLLAREPSTTRMVD